MGSRNKKEHRYSSLLSVPKTKRRKNKIRSSSTSKRTNVRFRGALKDMRKLSSNDEAFHLSLEEICDIRNIFLSRVTPTRRTYMKWDEYAISFYLKMCTCFHVDYKNLEAATSHQDDDDDDDKIENKPASKEVECLRQEEHMEHGLPSTQEMSNEDNIEEEEHMEHALPSTQEMSYENIIKEAWWNVEWIGQRRFLEGPFELGCYSSGTKPNRIPYHLYLLVKEAVDIMNRHNNTDDLKLVEQKINFFCSYFHSHLPTGWEYKLDNASSLIAGYDTKQGGRKYDMGGYTPFIDWGKANEYYSLTEDAYFFGK